MNRASGLSEAGPGQTSNLPAPLTPPECDLRGYDYMPLMGHRLFGSRVYTLALRNPRAGLAAIKLWWIAWQQCPAGSLPADEDELARLADFGSDTKTWRKVRDVALHGFIECSDGRLYHPVLCERALSSFEARIKHDSKREADRARLKAWRDAHRKLPPLPNGNGGGNSIDTRLETPSETYIETPTETRFVAGIIEREDKKERKQAKLSQACTPNSRATAEPPDPPPSGTVRPLMPARNDPPHRWLGLVAGNASLDRNGVARPVCNGTFVDGAADACCEAARINSASWRGDWRPLIAWLEAGYDLDSEILPAIRRVADRPNYQPPRSLAYFDQAVREAQRRR